MSLEITLEANTAALTAHTTVLRALLERLSAGGIPLVPAALTIAPVASAQAVAGPKSVTASPAPSPAATTAEKTAAPETTASASSPSAEVVATQSPPSTAAAEPITYDQVKPLILKINVSKGRDAAMAALAEFGVAKGPDLKPEQYADFVAYAAKVLA